MSSNHFDALRKPDWLKIDFSSEGSFTETSNAIKEGALHTICASGKCPNRSTCWNSGTATFMIGGNVCTRACRFCATESAQNPPALDPLEPLHVAESIKKMGLKYAVLTSVDRDDLEDGGASHWRSAVLETRKLSPGVTIEVLIPDFNGRERDIDTVLSSAPDVVGHNLETVRRLTPSIRHRATYDRSLSVLRHISESGFITKTGIMVGLGETEDEVIDTMKDCLSAGVSTLTIGQYLRPTKRHIPVSEYVHPDTFARYKEIGEKLGLSHVESGPLVRSSFRADRQFASAQEKHRVNLRELLSHKSAE